MSRNVLKMAVDVGIRDRNIFDWPNVGGAFDKLQEEIQELSEVLHNNDKAKVFEEFSDVFFTLLQVARHLKIAPEKNLNFALKKYDLRYKKMLELAEQSSAKNINEMPVDELEPYWQQAKKDTNHKLKDLLASYL